MASKRTRNIKLVIDYGEAAGDPKKIIIPFAPGDSVYLTNDHRQKEYHFAGFTFEDEIVTRYIVARNGNELEVFPFQVSDKKDAMPSIKDSGGETT